MSQYLIELRHDDSHTACVIALRALESYGSHFITHAYWGCRDGVHRGWLIVEISNRQAAIGLVPPEFRSDAVVVELTRFSREDIAHRVAALRRHTAEALIESVA